MDFDDDLTEEIYEELMAKSTKQKYYAPRNKNEEDAQGE